MLVESNAGAAGASVGKRKIAQNKINRPAERKACGATDIFIGFNATQLKAHHV
jgi:hypothetical protein